MPFPSRSAELIANRVPFVQATVVRAECPTSARPGDSAVVLADGSIDGFVGGQCAEGSVRAAALDVISSGDALLLRILPDGDAEFPESEGARTVVNPCLSGGALEIFLEPRLPASRLVVVGDTPIAQAVVDLAVPLGFDVACASGTDAEVVGAIAVLVASHGRDEDTAIRAALTAGVGFVGLVASRVRGEAVIASMDLTRAELARMHSPVGVDIGARTAEEIALSIMAEVVMAIRTQGLRATGSRAAEASRPQEVVDPVCGMAVLVGPETPHLNIAGDDYWFC
ncbi:MAG: XdhC family protein, partial [Acidimicrobiales bacterium]